MSLRSIIEASFYDGSMGALDRHQVEEQIDEMVRGIEDATRIITIKLPKNPAHNPHAKITGGCAVATECTDSTGEHHTLVIYDETGAGEADVRERYSHITRVETIA
ncbi:MAG: hypothetical protein K0S70_78 [Microbacterium sp.]|jgi:hypothetical protein|nr:hypothetical protein [Microbacterium sp.]